LDPPRYRERFAFAFALSLYLHGLILLLQFGSAGFGLPWAEQRVLPAPLTVRLAEAPRAPEPAAEPLQLRAARSLELRPRKAAPPQARLSLPRRETRTKAPAANKRAREPKIQAKPPPPVLAQAEPQEEPFEVPPPQPAAPEEPSAPETAAITEIEEAQAAAQAAQEEARRIALARKKALEAKKQEDARRIEAARKEEEAKKQAEAEQQALELEARRLAEETALKEAEDAALEEAEALARERALAAQKEEEAKELEAARLEEARKQQEAARIEEELKKEEARRLALELEALKRAEEAAQAAAARKKELEAQRLAEEAARAREAAEQKRAQEEAAAQRERDRIAALPGPAPGAPSGKELAAKALDQLRRPGPARDELLRRPSPPPVIETPRRRLIFGPERDVGVRMYVESWRNKIERNGALNYRRSAGWAARDSPVVSVAIRSDGTLEGVHIHRSSGLREIDEAVRRIARMNAPYSAFPPALARQYDVIEIRRVWFFDHTLRILDEVY
jgi:hypothetical protein